MEDVLAVYMRPRNPDRPLVCLDETSKQLIAETRRPVPMKPRRPARVDYEYERNNRPTVRHAALSAIAQPKSPVSSRFPSDLGGEQFCTDSHGQRSHQFAIKLQR